MDSSDFNNAHKYILTKIIKSDCFNASSKDKRKLLKLLRENPLLNVKGSKGDKGEKGGKGDKGLKGDKGPTSTAGALGNKGIKGEVGTQGIEGNKGTAGNQLDGGFFEWNDTTQKLTFKQYGWTLGDKVFIVELYRSGSY